MAIKTVVRITTTDTKKTYEFPSEKGHPNLWQVSLTVQFIDKNGRVSRPSTYEPPSGIVHVERKTLEDAGVLPMAHDRKTKDEGPTETVEDLIIRLLEHVGYYPCPGE